MTAFMSVVQSRRVEAAVARVLAVRLLLGVDFRQGRDMLEVFGGMVEMV